MALRAFDGQLAARADIWMESSRPGAYDRWGLSDDVVQAVNPALVFPVDRYLERTAWSDVAPAGMLVDAAQYSAVDYPPGNVIPVHSSARAVNLPSNTFDAVFSTGAIEHFGSLDNVAASAREIGRILR
jgi:hypothetical protein